MNNVTFSLFEQCGISPKATAEPGIQSTMFRNWSLRFDKGSTRSSDFTELFMLFADGPIDLIKLRPS